MAVNLCYFLIQLWLVPDRYAGKPKKMANKKRAEDILVEIAGSDTNNGYCFFNALGFAYGDIDCQESSKVDNTFVAKLIYDECHARGAELAPFKNYAGKGLTFKEISSCLKVLGWNAVVFEGSNKHVFKPCPELPNAVTLELSAGHCNLRIAKDDYFVCQKKSVYYGKALSPSEHMMYTQILHTCLKTYFKRHHQKVPVPPLRDLIRACLKVSLEDPAVADSIELCEPKHPL
jgi:hypothetical protein